MIEIEGGKEAEPIIARILSIAVTEAGKNMIVAADSKKIFTILVIFQIQRLTVLKEM